MKKLTMALLVACMVATVGAGTASAKAKGTDRPHKGVTYGTVTTPAPPGGDVGIQYATHLGKSTIYTTIESLDPVTGTFSGSFRVVTANGDEVYGAISNGVVVLTPDPLVFETTFDITITGGTGRFEGATGSAVGEGTGRVTSDPADPVLVSELTTRFSGTISY